MGLPLLTRAGCFQLGILQLQSRDSQAEKFEI